MMHAIVKKETSKDKDERLIVSAEGALEVMHENIKFLKEKFKSQ